MFEMLKDLWDFMRERKKFWLAPIVGAALAGFAHKALLEKA